MAVELVRNLRRGVVAVLVLPEAGSPTSVEDLQQRLAVPVCRGTAFSVSSDTFLTCNHVIQTAAIERLKLVGSANPDGGPPLIYHDALEVRSDPQTDIAIVKVRQARSELVPIVLDQGQPPVGLDILAVGYPLPEQRAPESIEGERRVNVAIQGTFRAVRGIVASRMPQGTHFEIDKLVNPGQSGGPVVSLETGRLVGICQAFTLYTVEGGQLLPSDLSRCIAVDVIRSKLNDWGISL
jgi:putative serine protease PepD